MTGFVDAAVEARIRIGWNEFRQLVPLLTSMDISLIMRWLQWYRHVLQKEDSDWVKKCMECEVEGARTGGRPKQILTEIVQKRLSDT